MKNKKNNPVVDIIIPNYNKEKYLKECVNSVLNQTYKNWKLYIIDDCSTDQSLNYLNQFRRKRKIKIISLKKNKGPSYCRNLGIKKSKNYFIAFLDSDDFWHKNKLKLQISFMIKNNHDLTYSDYFTFKDLDKNKKKMPTNLKNSFNFNEFIKNSSINSSTLVLKRKVIKGIKFRELKLLEDYIFKCDVLKKKYTAKKINKHLAFYRLNELNRSKSKFLNILFLWRVNKKFNNLSFYSNLLSVISISINSLKKYGLRK